MRRFEVRFYDALNQIKLAVELNAVDRPAAERAAMLYLRSDVSRDVQTDRLVLGAVRELR